MAVAVSCLIFNSLLKFLGLTEANGIEGSKLVVLTFQYKKSLILCGCTPVNQVSYAFLTEVAGNPFVHTQPVCIIFFHFISIFKLGVNSISVCNLNCIPCRLKYILN